MLSGIELSRGKGGSCCLEPDGAAPCHRDDAKSISGVVCSGASGVLAGRLCNRPFFENQAGSRNIRTFSGGRSGEYSSGRDRYRVLEGDGRNGVGGAQPGGEPEAGRPGGTGLDLHPVRSQVRPVAGYCLRHGFGRPFDRCGGRCRNAAGSIRRNHAGRLFRRGGYGD